MDNEIDELQNRINSLKKDISFPKPTESIKKITSNSSKGFELIGTPIVGGLIGMGFDKLFSTGHVFFLILAILGILAGFWSLFKAERNIMTPIDSKRLQNGEKTGIKAENHDMTK